MKTIVGLFERPERAEETVAALKDAGFGAENLTILNRVEALWQALGCRPGKILARDFSIGAALGIAVYAFFAVAVAVSELAVGFSPQLALGAMLLFAALGILVGGLLGAIFGYGDIEPPSGCPFHPRCFAKLGQICEDHYPLCFQVGAQRVACWLYSNRALAEENAQTLQAAANPMEGGGTQ